MSRSSCAISDFVPELGYFELPLILPGRKASRVTFRFSILLSMNRMILGFARLASFISAIQAQNAETGVLGRVTEEGNGAPIAGAIVTLLPPFIAGQEGSDWHKVSNMTGTKRAIF